MGSVKKKRRTKMSNHKRRKRLRADRHKTGAEMETEPESDLRPGE